MNYTIISIQEKKKWKDYIRRALYFDFYHSWHYHSAISDGEPLLFVYESAADFIAIPLIKRVIKGSDHFDLTSAYGYVGPVTNRLVEELEDGFLQDFSAAFKAYMSDEKIVSVFSRLHPLMGQNRILKLIGGVCETGATVYIDLKRPIEQQTAGYRKSVRNSIHSLVAADPLPTVREVKTENDLKTFASIYRENMLRIGASEYYQFDEEYFRDLMGTNEFFPMPLIMFKQDVAIAAGFFVFTNDIIQVHLLATRTDYLHLSPTKLLVHQASQIGREHKMRYLHLGGGVGGKNDSLYFWKTGFSDTSLDFHTWQFINDQKEYDQLVDASFAGSPTKSDFFPKYRATE